MALWHASPVGQQTVAIDYGNGTRYERGYVRSMKATTARLQVQLHAPDMEITFPRQSQGFSIFRAAQSG